MHVVDEADQRSLLGAVSQQVQHRESDQEPVRCLPSGQAEGSPEGDTLRSGQAVKSIQERGAELMQPGVGELSLGLDAGQSGDAATSCARFHIVEQCGLADSGLTPHDEHLALPCPRTRDQAVEGRAFAAPAEQRGQTITPITQRRTHADQNQIRTVSTPVQFMSTWWNTAESARTTPWRACLTTAGLLGTPLSKPAITVGLIALPSAEAVRTWASPTWGQVPPRLPDRHLRSVPRRPPTPPCPA